MTQMRMCKIVSGYKKDGGFMEITVDGDSCYEAIAKEAAKMLDLEKEGTALLLFRVDGTIVPNKEVDVNGASRRWTIERYLSSQGKTAQQLKLGVGYRYEVCYCISEFLASNV